MCLLIRVLSCCCVGMQQKRGEGGRASHAIETLNISNVQDVQDLLIALPLSALSSRPPLFFGSTVVRSLCRQHVPPAVHEYDHRHSDDGDSAAAAVVCLSARPSVRRSVGRSVGLCVCRASLKHLATVEELHSSSRCFNEVFDETCEPVRLLACPSECRV